MARKGLPKKYAKMGFKKGWAAFKRAKGAVKRGARKVAAKVTPRKRRSAPKRNTSKTITRRPASRAAAKTGGKKRMSTKFSWRRNKIANAVINGGVVTASVIAPPVALETLPIVKNWKTWQKVATQAGTGLLMVLFVKNEWAKKIGVGMIGGAGVTSLLPVIRARGFKVFGPNRRGQLTPGEMAELRLNSSKTYGPLDKVYGPLNKVYGPLSRVEGGDEFSPMSGRSGMNNSNFRGPFN